MLSLYRRHRKKCGYRGKGREHIKCACPIWCDGYLNDKDYRKSLKTRDWQRALRLVDRLEHPHAGRSDLIPCEQAGCNQRVEAGRCDKHRRALRQAIEAYFQENSDLAHGTLRNYRRCLKFLETWFAPANPDVHEIAREKLSQYRAFRKIAGSTWTKELEIIRSFFRFCVTNEWLNKSPAADVKMPKNLKPTDKEPYSRNDIVKILAASDTIGQQPYERLRARAMTLLLRYTALRIGDVAVLRKDRIRRGEIYLRTMKNGKVVKLPVRPELQAALDVLPNPRGSRGESEYFFWSGNGTVRSMIRDATRTMAAVFKASGVARTHAHRFRHTLATEILERGGSIEDAAEVLGNSPNIIRKHYAKWTPSRQERISTLFQAIFEPEKGTSEVHEKLAPATNRKQ
jgi:site-specific recombinase XerD